MMAKTTPAPLALQVCDVLDKTLSRKALLHEPSFTGHEWEYVKECLDTGWVSSAGKFVDRFESEIAAYTGSAHAVACVNGTSALHIALRAAGVEAGDEVLVPDLTFVATANAVAYCGALPHLVDSDEKTLGVDPVKLKKHLQESSKIKSGALFNRRTGAKIKALVAVHTFGHPVDLDALQRVCEEFHLILIEDAAESLGSFYKGRHTGTTGRFGILSFNGNKIVTAGGGGAVLCRDATDAQRIKHRTTTAKAPHAWNFYHDELGYNYRLPNINAALGCAQLEQLPVFLEKKRALAARYRENFLKLQGLYFFEEPPFAKSNYWLNAFLLNPENSSQRNEILSALNQKGFMARPAWVLMHKLPMYGACPRMDVSTAESLEARLINIPSSSFL